MKWRVWFVELRDELVPGWRYDPPGQAPFYTAYESAIGEIGTAGAGNHVVKLLAETQRAYDAETSRRESINTRAGALVGTAGVLGSLVVAAGQLGLGQKKSSPGSATLAVLVLFIISLIYLGAALILALRVHGAMQGSVIDPTDLSPRVGETATPDLYGIRIAQVQLRYTVFNYRLNNLLKYRLLSSQRCLRNGILAIITAGILSPFGLRA